MLEYLFAQSTYIAIVIGGLLGLGFSFFLLRWRIKFIALGPSPRKKVSIIAGVVCISIGLIGIFLMIITAFLFHAPLFNHWIIWFAVDVVLETIGFTVIFYIGTSRVVKQIRFLLGRASNVPFTENRRSYQQPGLRNEITPPHQTSRSGPQPKETREEE